METLIFLLLIIFFIVFLDFQAKWRRTINVLSRTVENLLDDLDELKELLKKQAGSESKVSTTTPTPKESTVISPTPKPIYKPLETKTEINQPKNPEPVFSSFKKEEQVIPNNLIKEPKEDWYTKWKLKHPDWEKFIGENLINKIGIAILVLGIAFFVKYAIDKDWINETGRVSIGILLGAVLIFLAHRLRKEYRSFSSVLAGGGIAVFYSTIAFAFQGYGLISQTVAFISMVVITIFAVALSLLNNRLELAVIAAIGGFITPFLVSNGEGNYIVLFTYLIILNAGLLLLSYYKRWTALNIFSIAFTVLLTGGWITLQAYKPTKNVSYPTVLLFITALYCIFLSMNLVYQVKNKAAFKALDFSILLFLSACHYAGGMIVLNWINKGAYQGMFTLGCGLIDLVLAWYFFKRKQTDKNLLYLLIGLTMTFISLAVPIQLHGHAITLFWSGEFVLLYWLYQQSGIRLFKLISIIVMALSLVSLGMDWGQSSEKSSVILLIYDNLQGLVTNFVSATAFIFYGILLNKDKEIKFGEGFSTLQVKRFAWILAILLLYITSIFGINLIYRTYPNYIIPNVYHRLITNLFALGIITWLIRKTSIRRTLAILILTILSFLHYFFSQPLIEGLRNDIISGIYPSIYIVIHFISDGILLLLTFLSIKAVLKNKAEYKHYFTGLTWVVSVVLIAFFSFELAQPYVLIGSSRSNLNDLLDQYNKAILTVIWSLCSFTLMWFGMHYKNKLLRIISLVVFSIALLKLFAWDIQNISEGGKIIAFILLGILLLTISFMYQKLKKILIVNDTN